MKLNEPRSVSLTLVSPLATYSFIILLMRGISVDTEIVYKFNLAAEREKEKLCFSHKPISYPLTMTVNLCA